MTIDIPRSASYQDDATRTGWHHFDPDRSWPESAPLTNGAETRPGPPDVDTFLRGEEDPYDWLVPGLLERGDRLILTGVEGGGKSTWMRQLALCAAAGVHPFTHQPTTPCAVLLVDVENSRRQTRRKLRPLRQLVPALDPDRLRIKIHTAGLNLLAEYDRVALETWVEQTRPDMLISGPIYKLVGGDPVKEEPARAAIQFFDYLRAKYRVCVVLEAHTAKQSGGEHRPETPYGASLWMRWPEFGIHLSKTGRLSHWRGERDEREWPKSLKRGQVWPWEMDRAGDESFRPTHLMETMSRYLETQAQPISKNAWLDATHGNRDARLVAIDLLIFERHVQAVDGPRKSRLCSSISPFRDEPHPSDRHYTEDDE